MPSRVRNVFGIVCWVIAGFFLYSLCVLSFINRPLWPMKLAVLGVFLTPCALLVLIAGWCRGFGRLGRELGIVLLSAAGMSLLVVLMFVCIYASPETARSMPPDMREMFSAIWSGTLCLAFYVVFGLFLLRRRGSEATSRKAEIGKRKWELARTFTDGGRGKSTPVGSLYSGVFVSLTLST
jgi:hypothetical protein